MVRKVLIVEDDPMVAMINRSYVEMVEGFQVVATAVNQVEVFEVLKKEYIDLIILDVFLPESNGLVILKNIREKGYLVDVIMVTAANALEDVKKAMAYGVVDYLVKPFEAWRFTEALNKYRIKSEIFKDNNISQKDLDAYYTDLQAEKTDIPKGLHEKTLKRVVELMSKEAGKVWTIREISRELSVSNVTIKKYMDYLEEMRRVRVTTTHGNVGRPEYNYEFIR